MLCVVYFPYWLVQFQVVEKYMFNYQNTIQFDARKIVCGLVIIFGTQTYDSTESGSTLGV